MGKSQNSQKKKRVITPFWENWEKILYFKRKKTLANEILSKVKKKIKYREFGENPEKLSLKVKKARRCAILSKKKREISRQKNFFPTENNYQKFKNLAARRFQFQAI